MELSSTTKLTAGIILTKDSRDEDLECIRASEGALGSIRATISSYEKRFGKLCDLLFDYRAGRLESARIEPIVIIGGSKASLDALHNQRAVLRVDALDPSGRR